MVKCAGLAFMCAPLVMAAPCDSLKAIGLPYATISVAEQIAAGKFSPRPGDIEQAEAHGTARIRPEEAKNLPSFCRVTAEIMPVPDSRIRIEVWMPVSDWNGKFIAVGMADGLERFHTVQWRKRFRLATRQPPPTLAMMAPATTLTSLRASTISVPEMCDRHHDSGDV